MRRWSRRHKPARFRRGTCARWAGRMPSDSTSEKSRQARPSVDTQKRPLVDG